MPWATGRPNLAARSIALRVCDPVRLPGLNSSYEEPETCELRFVFARAPSRGLGVSCELVGCRENCPPQTQSPSPPPRCFTRALLRHYLGTTQDMFRKNIKKWFRQVDNALQVSGVLQTEMSTLRENSDRDRFRAIWAPKMGPLGNCKIWVYVKKMYVLLLN